MGAGLKIIKVVVALARGVLTIRDPLSAAVQRVNQKAAGENRGAQVEIVGWYDEDSDDCFYRESPRLLLDKICAEHRPDIILGVFWGRLGARKLDNATEPELELELLSRMLAQPDGPQVNLYFLHKDFNPQTADEAEQKEFFNKFRAYFSSVSNSLWSFVKEPKISDKAADDLWMVVSQKTRINKLTPDLNLPGDEWQAVDSRFLGEARKFLGADDRLPAEVAANYFDGESPKWEYIVSKSIRPRVVVEKLENEISVKATTGRPRVTLLIGPGGEGKSTILQQVAIGLAERHQDIHIIWRNITTGRVVRLEESLIRQLLHKEGYFVIVSDNAEQIADDVWQSVLFLQSQKSRSNIQFLLASRTIDWQWAGADKPHWRRQLGESDFHAERINSLTKEDARRVVGGWEDAGMQGLGQFQAVEPDKRAQHLFKLAEDKRVRDREEREGSLLGAMLDARKSATFKDYVKGILGRLEQRAAPGGRTLREVFAYIVALHADNQQILAKPILGHLLACSPDELAREVLTPLADEAAADSSGWLVLARHRTIAEVAREILIKDFHVNFDHQILPDLVRTAIELYLKNKLSGDEIRPWNNLPKFYAKLKQIELAIRLVKVLADAEPDDPFFVVTWANILRGAGGRNRAEKDGNKYEAANIFRQRYHLISVRKMNKGFFAEWAVSEGQLDNYCFNIWLCGIALCDRMTEKHEGDTPPIMLLSGLTSAFNELYKKTANPHNRAFFDQSNAQTFLKACVAAAQLGLDKRAQKDLRPDFDLGRAMRYLDVGKRLGDTEGIVEVESDEAISRILEGIKLAWDLRAKDKGELPTTLPAFGELTFRNLYAFFRR